MNRLIADVERGDNDSGFRLEELDAVKIGAL